MIDDIRQFAGHGIRPICDALGAPRSSYYHAAEPTPTQRSDQEIGDLIQAIFKRHRRRYGYLLFLILPYNKPKIPLRDDVERGLTGFGVKCRRDGNGAS